MNIWASMYKTIQYPFIYRYHTYIDTTIQAVPWRT
jgi:hypothetical protein